MRREVVVLLLFSSLQVLVHATSYYDEPCYIDACKTAECPAQRGAICKSIYNGCVARFYDKYGNDVTENCQCPKNVRSRRCTRDPCDHATCSKRGQCRTDTCGGCDPVFYDRNAKPITGCPDDPNKGICPPLPKDTFGICVELCGNKCPGNQLCCSNGCGHVCKDPYYPECPGGGELACKPPACWKTQCPGQMGAVCRAKCFGCIPFFYDEFDNDVTDKCECPRGIKPVECAVDPCKGQTCYNHPDAVCRGSRCGTCKANFYDKRGRKVQCRKNDCPGGKELHCLINACQYPNCPRHMNAECKTTCNGCIAHYFDKFDNEIKCDCRRGQLVAAKCRRNMCRNKVCHGYPDAECRVSKCGGCHIEFYDERGRQITCEKPPLDVACPPPDPKIIKNLPVMLCPAPVCYTNADCRGNDLCCSDGCSQRCISPPFVDPRCPSDDGVFGPCINLCRSNLDCADKDQICCKNGCGTICKNKPLDERCPPPDPKIIDMLPFITCLTSSCKSNSDCKGKKICCNNGCSNQCVTPPGYDERCPLAVAPVSKIPCPAKVCSSNSDCRSDYMCCGLFCGSHCTPKARTCEEGEYLAKCRDLCKFAKCRKYPGAECRVHGCNGCKVEFYDKFTNRLYKDCDDIDLPPFA